MKNIYKTGLSLLLTGVLAFTGCTNSFDEVNTDPDAYEEVPPTNILGYCLRYMSQQIGGDLDGFGTWAGYIVKIQYMDYMSDYQPSNNTYGNRWAGIYRCNSQLNTLLEDTEEEKDYYSRLRLVAQVWQNYLWQYGTDTYRDMPYSQALQGPEIMDPKYDKQEDIYPAVMADLKRLADEMAADDSGTVLGEGDFLFNGDFMKWRRFCNSLRLRMAMRISEVDEVLARTTIEEICGNPSQYPVIESNNDKAYFWWQGSYPYQERWYFNRYQDNRDDHGMHEIFIDHMQAMNDPRIHAIANPTTYDKDPVGTYRGFQNGPSSGPNPLSTISRIGSMYRDDPSGFTPHYKACETYYILAEAAMLGFNTGISAQDAYEKAVRLSMEENNVEEADINTYLAGSGRWDNTKDRIWWDMWVALFKENQEAWCLYRRTGVPTTNYIAIESVQKGIHNDHPFRCPYPLNQYNYAKDQLEKVMSNPDNYCWDSQMWWDTRTGVY